ncbi:MAG: COP23 domain-containing protein [Gomphosphaeria aponina SAG 52.96 = DSM 107014]|uniref:COP23 domain-containing protein n=1 Tax=Gomphosphaeria aponina SAG 52.96 = DSM 107014 TaxID=1521640 RepID=A0A941GWG7_9CHRO|nr:COP23 domain-containing protein [Gomphosphaeria aponina SAG 52.96 = DSM 107014]
MKTNFLTGLLTVSALTLASAFIASKPAEAQLQSGTKFVCGYWQGVPATIAQTPTANVPVIRWVSNHFEDSGYTPQTRCEIVSNKFQEYYNNGTLNYLTTGIKNGYDIVCAAQYDGGSCVGQLFTLKPGSNPNQTLQDLMAVRLQASGPLNESSGRVYIDMNEYLQEATTAANNSPETPIQPVPSPSTEKPTGSVW